MAFVCSADLQLNTACGRFVGSLERSTAPRGVQMHYARPCAQRLYIQAVHRALFDETPAAHLLVSVTLCLNLKAAIFHWKPVQTSHPGTIRAVYERGSEGSRF